MRWTEQRLAPFHLLIIIPVVPTSMVPHRELALRTGISPSLHTYLGGTISYMYLRPPIPPEKYLLGGQVGGQVVHTCRSRAGRHQSHEGKHAIHAPGPMPWSMDASRRRSTAYYCRVTTQQRHHQQQQQQHQQNAFQYGPLYTTRYCT